MRRKTEDKSRLSSLSIAGVYIGAVIGAGFASGQEIWRFFGLHGAGGFVGLALSGFLFAFFALAILCAGKLLQARSHLEVVNAIGGPMWGALMDGFITICLPVSLTVMLAGAGAGLAEQYGIPSFVGSTAMALATALTVLMGIQGVVVAISLLAPLFVSLIMIVSVQAMRPGSVDWPWAMASSMPRLSWLFSSLAYVTYNLILSASVLAPVGALAPTRAIIGGSLLGGLGLGLGAAAVNIAVLSQGPAVISCDVPMLLVAEKMLPTVPWIFMVLLLIEIYTTAVAGLYGFAARLAPEDRGAFMRIVLVTTLFSLIAARVGFSRLVAVVYSAMGYVGAVFLAALTRWFWKTLRAGQWKEPPDM
ncbi:MAG: hypothetical protein GX162_10425 [Firmicutes bacterium]|jgi:uncharacterized membrane protein YkvI|nr:hypothetical protein [Bacillota bacterium]